MNAIKDILKAGAGTQAMLTEFASGQGPQKPVKRTKTHSTAAETVKMHGLLKEYLHGPIDGLWKYADGWSDAKIAEEIGREGVGPHHVARIRVELFGPLVKTSPPVQKSEMLKRIELLEMMFNRLALEAGSNLHIEPPPGWTK